MFANGAQVWGVQPDGTKGNSRADLGEVSDNPGPKQTTAPQIDKPETTTSTTVTTTVTTTKPEAEGKFLYGDTNCSGNVDVSDAVLLARFLAEDTKAQVTAQGRKNADCDGKAGLTSDDTTRILMYIAKLVTDDQMGKTI